MNTRYICVCVTAVLALHTSPLLGSPQPLPGKLDWCVEKGIFC